MECLCIMSDFWCPALFDAVLQEFVKAAYHSKSVTAEQRDLLLRSFAEAVTRVVFPKPGEVLRLPVGTDTDMVFEHPATRHHTIDVVRVSVSHVGLLFSRFRTTWDPCWLFPTRWSF